MREPKGVQSSTPAKSESAAKAIHVTRSTVASLDTIPKELVIKIFEYLKRDSFYALARANKYFQAISKDKALADVSLHTHFDHLKKVLSESYDLSDNKYHQGGISRSNKRLLKFKYLEFCAYLEELTEQHMPGLDDFLKKNTRLIECVAKDAKIKKNENMSWKEIYMQAIHSKGISTCRIS